uniref:Uncharacterized protein n=1 Tax=Aegilops tauschii subsp. strangulata TaxID=200361 RepID=A0A453QQG9_AEGTS
MKAHSLQRMFRFWPLLDGGLRMIVHDKLLYLLFFLHMLSETICQDSYNKWLP